MSLLWLAGVAAATVHAAPTPVPRVMNVPAAIAQAQPGPAPAAARAVLNALMYDPFLPAPRAAQQGSVEVAQSSPPAPVQTPSKSASQGDVVAVRGSIEGKVVDAVSGAPVPGAVVTLTVRPGQPSRPGEPPNGIGAPKEQPADAEGRFTFRDLGAGFYLISAQRQGSVDRPQERVVPSTPLVLGVGQQLTGYVLRLAPLTVITGRVLDSNGDPVPGALVAALQWEESTRGPLLGTFAREETNSLGEYRLTNLAPSSYLVSAALSNATRMDSVAEVNEALPDKPQWIDALTYYPGVTDPAAATALAVGATALIQEIDLKLAQTNSVSVRGKVTGPGGSPLGLVTVSLLPWRPVTTLGLDHIDLSVRPDGAFLIRNVVPGTYALAAKRTNAEMSSDMWLSAVQQIQVSDKNLDGLTLRLAPAVDIPGTVTADPAGVCKPTNATVSLTPTAPLYYGGTGQAGKVGEDLKFTLHGVAPQTYFVNYTSGARNCYVKSVSFGGREAPPTAVPLTRAGTLSITLGVAAATLDVTVVGAAGIPAVQLAVMALPIDSGAPLQTRAGAAPDGTYSVTLPPGTYRVYAWQEDQSRTLGIWALFGRFAPRAAQVTVPESGHVAVIVNVIPAADLADPPATALPPPPPTAKGSLAGQVINAGTDMPVPGVTVSLQNSQVDLTPTVSADTDEQGRFEFQNLDPGAYTVSATHQTLAAGSSELPLVLFTYTQVLVSEGQRVTGVTLRPTPQATISGKIVDESGNPVKGAQVAGYRYRTSFGQAQLAPFGSGVTDDQGFYHLLNLQPGTYYIGVLRIGPLTPPAFVPAASITGPFPSEPETGYAAVWYPNAADLAGASAVHAGADAPVADINMTWRKRQLARIRGKVVDPSETLPGQPLVRLAPKGPAVRFITIGNAAVAPDGSFEISGVPAGSYWLTAQYRESSTPTGPAAAASARLRSYVAVQSIDVKGANIDGIKLEMNPGRTVTETTKVEGGDVPQSCATLVLFASAMPTVSPSFSCSHGNLTYRYVHPLVYTMSVDTRQLPAIYYVKSILYGGKEILRSGVDFSGPGEFEITLGATGAIVEGVVTDSRGRPVGGASMVVAPADGAELRMGNADALGHYYFANLAPGEYRLFAWEGITGESITDAALLAPFAAAAKTVKLGDNAHETLPLTAIRSR